VDINNKYPNPNHRRNNRPEHCRRRRRSDIWDESRPEC